MSITTIDANAEIATLVNSFTVDPDRQQELVRVLVHATEEVMQHQAGFIAANIHASLDGTRVVNYAQWESSSAFEAMLKNPDCRVHMEAAGRIADADPHLYTVESVHHRPLS